MSSTLQLPASFTSTHDTDGLPNFPAIDEFAAPGTQVLAPAGGVLLDTHLIPWDIGKRVGGYTTYLVTTKGVYFLTHFGTVLPSGTKVAPGQPIGTVGQVPDNAWQSHIHEGFHVGAYSPGGTSTAGIGGIPSYLVHGTIDAITGNVDALNKLNSKTPVAEQVSDTAATLSSVPALIGRVTDPAYILRGLQIVAGAVMVLVGVVLLARQVALANDLPDPIAALSKGAIGGAADTAEDTTTVHRVGIRKTRAGNIATSDLGSYER